MATDFDTKELEDALLVKFFQSEADQARLLNEWHWAEQLKAAQQHKGGEEVLLQPGAVKFFQSEADQADMLNKWWWAEQLKAARQREIDELPLPQQDPVDLVKSDEDQALFLDGSLSDLMAQEAENAEQTAQEDRGPESWLDFMGDHHRRMDEIRREEAKAFSEIGRGALTAFPTTVNETGRLGEDLYLAMLYAELVKQAPMLGLTLDDVDRIMNEVEAPNLVAFPNIHPPTTQPAAGSHGLTEFGLTNYLGGGFARAVKASPFVREFLAEIGGATIRADVDPDAPPQDRLLLRGEQAVDDVLPDGAAPVGGAAASIIGGVSNKVREAASKKLTKWLPRNWKADDIVDAVDNVGETRVRGYEYHFLEGTNTPAITVEWELTDGTYLGRKTLVFGTPKKMGDKLRPRIFLGGVIFDEKLQGTGYGPEIHSVLFRKLKQISGPPIIKGTAAGLTYKLGQGDIGSYVWAKWGFLPDDWPQVKKKITKRLRELEVSDEESKELLDLLARNDKEAIWEIADLNNGIAYDVKGRSAHFGKYILANLDEYGIAFDLDNKKQISRFEFATGEKL